MFCHGCGELGHKRNSLKCLRHPKNVGQQTLAAFLAPTAGETSNGPPPQKRMRVETASADITREERASSLYNFPGFRGCTLWLTGLSGAGKTTIARGVEKTLIQQGIPAYRLDGDDARHGAQTARALADAGMIVLASFISPLRIDRQDARQIHEQDGLNFFEVHVGTPLDVCEARDPKKLYEKARSGKLQGFTGIDSIYEAPTAPDLVLKAGEESEADCVQQVLQFLYEKGILPEEAFGRLFENNDDEASDEHFAYIKVDKAVLSAAQTPEERRKAVLKPGITGNVTDRLNQYCAKYGGQKKFDAQFGLLVVNLYDAKTIPRSCESTWEAAALDEHRIDALKEHFAFEPNAKSGHGSMLKVLNEAQRAKACTSAALASMLNRIDEVLEKSKFAERKIYKCQAKAGCTKEATTKQALLIHEEAHRLDAPPKYKQYKCAEAGDCGLDGGKIFVADNTTNLFKHLASKHKVADSPEVRKKYGIRSKVERKKPANFTD